MNCIAAPSRQAFGGFRDDGFAIGSRVGAIVSMAIIGSVMAVLYLGMPTVMQAWRSGEMSQNAGGLVRWPVYAMMPLGFSLLLLQGISELIKRIAFLRGLIDDPGKKAHERTAEEELAEEIRRLAGENLPKA